MRGILVVNPAARAGKGERDLDRIVAAADRSLGEHEVVRSQAPGHITEIVASRVDQEPMRVCVVGGDGSLNEALNGLMEAAHARESELVPIPRGTGGDFARTLGITQSPGFGWLQECDARRVDVGKLERHGNGSRYFINVASCGASGRVVEEVSHTNKKWGGRIAFFGGTVRGLWKYHNRKVRVRADDVIDEEMRVNTIALANARYFGGGMMIAPDAKLDDGKLDVVIVGNVGLPTFLAYSPALYVGKHKNLPGIRSFRATSITIEPATADAPAFETDGELVGHGGATVTCLRQAVAIRAPWARARGAVA